MNSSTNPTDGVRLLDPPSSGPLKQWIIGVVTAALSIGYSPICIERGVTVLFSSNLAV
jgi:hypothetical protein